MGNAREADQSRSVFILSRPVKLLGFQLLSSAPTFRCLGLLISPLVEEELKAVTRCVAGDEAPLGTLWEVHSTHPDKAEVKVTASFSIPNTNKTPLSIEYCGKTVMTDESIIEEGRLPCFKRANFKLPTSPSSILSMISLPTIIKILHGISSKRSAPAICCLCLMYSYPAGFQFQRYVLEFNQMRLLMTMVPIWLGLTFPPRQLLSVTSRVCRKTDIQWCHTLTHPSSIPPSNRKLWSMRQFGMSEVPRNQEPKRRKNTPKVILQQLKFNQSLNWIPPGSFENLKLVEIMLPTGWIFGCCVLDKGIIPPDRERASLR